MLAQSIEKLYEQGRETGIEQERRETVVKMLAEKVDISLIVRVTGFSVEEIQRLRNTL